MNGGKKSIKGKALFRFLSVLLSLNLIFGVACSSPASPEEKISAVKKIVEENLTPIKQRMELLKEIGSKADKHPVITSMKMEWGKRPKMSRYFFLDPKEKRSRSVVNLSLYQLLGKTKEKEISLSLGSWYTTIKDYLLHNYDRAWLVQTTEFAISKVEEMIKTEVDEFLSPRYLMVVRTHELIRPELIKMVESGQETEDTFGRKIAGEFKRGSVRGDVLVYDMSEGLFLGGLPFYNESSSFINAEKVKNDPEAFISDLINSVQYNVWEKLKPYMKK
jgi:hypothetical protein